MTFIAKIASYPPKMQIQLNRQDTVLKVKPEDGTWKPKGDQSRAA